MPLVRKPFVIHILPRVTWTWKQFVANTPPCSIALDGMVLGGPRMQERGRRVNFDHHDGVVREATMSTCMQVYFAIKGGLLDWFGGRDVHVWINDTDQDTSLAVGLLLYRKLFEGAAGVPHLNRLLDITNKLDIMSGAFPMNLDDRLLRQHNWVFEPYARLRKSGALATASEEVMAGNLEAVLSRFSDFLMNRSEEVELDTEHAILYDGPHFKIIDEIGGNEARYHLFAQGLRAYVSIVARRPDGRLVCTIGRRSRYEPFQQERHYDDLNAAESLTRKTGWNGSDIVGGSSRENGTGLSWEEIRDVLLTRYR